MKKLDLENLKVIDWNITGIYKIENIYSHNMYIGQAKDIRKRLREHLECCKSSNPSENKGLVNAWNKYNGDCFDFEILEICEETDLNDREKYWIDYYDSFKNGYNMTSGGQDNYTTVEWTDEQRKYFSQIRNPKEVLQIDFDGNIVAEYWSVAQVAKNNNIDSRGIYSCCNKGISKTVKGFIWIYKDDYDNFDIDYHLNRKQKKPVEQYDLDGNLIKIWNHGCEIKEAGFNPSKINSCCNHHSLSAYGYIWKFVNDKDRIIDKKYCDEAKRKLESVKVHKIYQIDNDYHIINIFNSIHEAGRNGFHENMISQCCRHIKSSYKGYIWLYEEEYQMHKLDEQKRVG
jgi:hypothetical protein